LGSSGEPGIYPYVLDGDERHLNIRAFYERQKGISVKCDQHFEFDEMERDHANPWREGGKTNARTARCCARTTIGGRRESIRIPQTVYRNPLRQDWLTTIP
jgi:hypothetical protein